MWPKYFSNVQFLCQSSLMLEAQVGRVSANSYLCQIMNLALFIQSKSLEVRKKASAFPWRQHLCVFCRNEPWESLGSKHVTLEDLYSTAVYSAKRCKVTLGEQHPFSQTWLLYFYSMCTPLYQVECIYRVCFHGSEKVLPGGPHVETP